MIIVAITGIVKPMLIWLITLTFPLCLSIHFLVKDMCILKNFGDRQNLSLWHNGDELIEKIADKCHKTVVVVSSTGPINMERWIEHDNVVAVLFAPPLGQFVGQAIADVLFGDVNPSENYHLL